MILVTAPGTRKRLRLTGLRERLLRRELRRAMHWPPARSTRVAAAADLIIRFRTPGGAVREYTVLGECVLKARNPTRYWQFWFGLILLRWM